MINITNWMGRYRSLIHALVRYANSFTRIATQRKNWGDGIQLSAWEWQLLEYIIETDDQCKNMLSISNSLGIAQSSISKYAKTLLKYNLIEKYQYKNNRKDIVLKVTQKGLNLYQSAVDADMFDHFKELFSSLDGIPDEILEQFVHAIEDYNSKRLCISAESKELVKIDS